MPEDPLPGALSRALFLTGPTAVGKTEVALAVAKEFNAEIVGADAFQIYQGLDLLTAKPTPEELATVPHHLVGTVPLSESFSTGRYLDAARAAILDIDARGKMPLIVGGTGLYLRALTRGLADTPPSRPELRDELAALPLDELLSRLETLDPEAAAAIDRQNPRRVVRALEVCLLTGKPFSSFREEWKATHPFHGIVLIRERDELYSRIDRRAAALFEHGVIDEVREAITEGIGPTAEQVIGLREIQTMLRGELSKAECIAAIAQSTRHYAKRQLTWFRREPMLEPLSLSAETDIKPGLSKSGLSPILRRIADHLAAPPPSPTDLATGPRLEIE